MTTFLNYVAAFWSVVVMNCIQPVNWKYCYRVDQWLIPGIQEGVHLYMNPSSIYQEEREYLEMINKDIEK
jgi:hypothetical protein